MATTLYLTNAVADTHLGTDTLRGGAEGSGAASSWTSRALSTARGSGVTASFATPTATVATDPVQPIMASSGIYLEWISPPVAADVTISGTVTFNVWASESNMSANMNAFGYIEVVRANATATRNSNTLAQLSTAGSSTELAVTTRAVQNSTDAGPPGETIYRGDRIRVFIGGAGGLSPAATYTWNVGYGGTSAAADGDSYVTFTENLTFESAPAGSVVYLTDTASAVATASVDKEAWTSRGSGVTSIVTNTSTGWTAPVQATATAGGTVVDWFTRPLTAFTLTGMAVANIRALESNLAANASLRCEIARVEGDGTSPTVWASWCCAPTGSDNGELTTTEVARTINLSGDDLAISNGQRLRIRLYNEDISAAAMVTGHTVTRYYGGTSGGASGDTYLTFPMTLTEYGGGGGSTPGPASLRRRPASRFLTSR